MDKNHALNAHINTSAETSKQLATLRARCALKGYELHEICKGSSAFFELRRGGQTRACSTAHDVEGVLAQTKSIAGAMP